MTSPPLRGVPPVALAVPVAVTSAAVGSTDVMAAGTVRAPSLAFQPEQRP